MPIASDFVGKSFSRLRVIERLENDKWNSTMWLCECECGNLSKVRASDLIKEKQKSCGCLKKEQSSETGKKSKTHGMKGERPYQIWDCMKQRCLNPKSNNYKNYGERGVSVCEKWMTFEGFWEDMQEGYSEHLSIDRIDVSGNYCKDNCKWSTYSEQGYNKRKICTNKSGRTGVCWDKNSCKWEAKIVFQGKKIYLGRYESFEDAVKAREEAELKYFGFNKE